MFMNKQFKNYIICWIVAIIAFNIISFVTPGGFDRTGNFWVGYVFTMLILVGHLVYVHVFINRKGNLTIENTLRVLNYIELPVLVIIPIVCMFITNLPVWIAVIACTVILAITVIFSVCADTVTNKTVNAYEADRRNSEMMRTLQSKVEYIARQARGTSREDITKKIYEAIRYSNPMSDETTREIEKVILYKLENDEIDEELLELVNRRNEITLRRPNNYLG